jgi:hypothetical protein
MQLAPTGNMRDNESVLLQSRIAIVGIVVVACSVASCSSNLDVAKSKARSACVTETPVAPLGPAPSTTFEKVLVSYQQARSGAVSAAADDQKWSPMVGAIAVEIKLWSQVVEAYGPNARHSLDLGLSNNPSAQLVNRTVLQLDMESPIATLTALCAEANS